MAHRPVHYVSHHAVAAGRSLAAAAGRLAAAARVTRQRAPHAPGAATRSGNGLARGRAEAVRTDTANAMMAAEADPGRSAYAEAF